MPEPHRYYDHDDEHIDQYGRRDTYGSDGSNVDDDRYYEHGGGYDYGQYQPSFFSRVSLNPPRPTGHRLGRRRVRPKVRPLTRIARAPSHGHFRILNAYLPRPQRRIRTRALPGVEL